MHPLLATRSRRRAREARAGLASPVSGRGWDVRRDATQGHNSLQYDNFYPRAHAEIAARGAALSPPLQL